MEDEGVIFITGVNVGRDVTAEELQREYDAVVLACGAKQARGLKGADTEKIKGIFYAVDFLCRSYHCFFFAVQLSYTSRMMSTISRQESSWML